MCEYWCGLKPTQLTIGLVDDSPVTKYFQYNFAELRSQGRICIFVREVKSIEKNSLREAQNIMGESRILQFQQYLLPPARRIGHIREPPFAFLLPTPTITHRHPEGVKNSPVSFAWIQNLPLRSCQIIYRRQVDDRKLHLIVFASWQVKRRWIENTRV